MAFGSYVIARLIRMPMPHLLGPMLVSLLLNAFGIVETVRLNEFILLAQITIGGQIGSRLSRVPFREVISYLIDGLLVSMVTLSIYTSFAVGVAALLGMRLLDAYIGFVPGGLYEVTVLSVLFGLDVAFVAFHNTLRVVHPKATAWVLADIEVRAIANGFAHGIVNLWSPDGELLGIAEQTGALRIRGK